MVLSDVVIDVLEKPTKERINTLAIVIEEEGMIDTLAEACEEYNCEYDYEESLYVNMISIDNEELQDILRSFLELV
jgi:hypothetical protein